MGVIAMTAAVICFWKFVSHRAAFLFLGFLAIGLVTYMSNPEERTCRDRSWFCPIVVDKPELPKIPEVCAPAEPLAADTRVFESDAANAELRRQIQSGVCQQKAIERIARGWKAPYDASYASRLQKAD